MDNLNEAVKYIAATAKVPSFSTYEERLHPYIRSCFKQIGNAKEIQAPNNNLIFYLEGARNQEPIALAAHLDKINHYGEKYPEELPVAVTGKQIEGAMDDSAGVGILLAIAESISKNKYKSQDLFFFFSEMEESKGLKEHPHLLKNNGNGYESGMGARRITETCIAKNIMPQQVITVDTTPLFKGDSGVALYSPHWEYHDIQPSEEQKEATDRTVKKFLAIDEEIQLENNTNDYLQYGKHFNKNTERPVVSVALEPAIFPYHQKGEKVFLGDIERVLNTLTEFIGTATN